MYRERGDIGLFKVAHETGVAAGVRRVEAVTGEIAQQQINTLEDKLASIATQLKVPVDDIDKRLAQLLASNKEQSRQIQSLQASMANQRAGALMDQVKLINGVKWLPVQTRDEDIKQLRGYVDQLKSEIGSGVVVLVNVSSDQKVNVLAGVTTDLTDQYHAGKLVAKLSEQLGGKGGGKADFGQGGGTDSSNIDSLLDKIETLI